MKIEFRDIIFGLFVLLLTLLFIFYPTHHDSQNDKLDTSPPPSVITTNLP